MKVSICAKSDGDGYWSHQPGRSIDITDLSVNVSDHTFGELCAKFNPINWDVKQDGLIYTDKGWLRSFKHALTELGFSDDAANSIGYSEQGMQTDSYVSMDVGASFIVEWGSING